nr:hypothetical protein [Eubacterium sp.]
QSGLVSSELLLDIPVKEVAKEEKDTIEERPVRVDKYQVLYERETLKNKKMKIAMLAMMIMLAGFVAINFRFQYSIFTYFTNYKANMEEEIINRYETWQEELDQREQKLKEREDAVGSQTVTGQAVE